ncbi:hypothetical protein C8J57DRAFT_1503908 [Mycena rebaudengoi]|nr:hypothetical protein C8J57DRAFT_1503908 [Mycena rebaudengoi]
MRPCLAAALLVGLLTPFTLAVPVESTETVLTPGGYHLKSHVHEVPVGGRVVHVEDEINLIAANGTILYVASPSNVTSRATVTPRALQTGWVTYAHWDDPEPIPIGVIDSTWTVPPLPATARGQEIFLFNALRSTDGNIIIQSVLQYGASVSGGGPFWSVTNWYTSVSPLSIFFSTPVRVNPGQVLNSEINPFAVTGANLAYVCSFLNILGSDIVVYNVPKLQRAYIVLETWNVVAKSDLPAGSTVFSSVHVSHGIDWPQPTVVWSHVDDVADGTTTTINTDGGVNGRITIKY